MADTISTVPRTRRGWQVLRKRFSKLHADFRSQNCRLRHLKCDEQRPGCARCAKAGIECVRGYNIRFRHGANPSVATGKGSGLSRSDYDFAKDQIWLSTTKRHLTFLDETEELISIYDQDSDQDHGTNISLHRTGSTYSAPINVQHDRPEAERTRIVPSILDNTDGFSAGDLTSPSKRRRLTYSSSQGSLSGSPGQYQHSPAISWHIPSQGELSSTPVDSGVHDSILDPTFASPEPTVSNILQSGPIFTAVSENLSRVSLDAPQWPLQNKEEAKLMRYFVEHLAQSFDLTDPVNHFRTVVPQRAALCPTLLNAVFAAAARHLSRTSDYDPMVSNRYHQECLKHLIPMLDDTASILDENLLASTVILRYLEEIDVPLSGALHSADGESHLLGTHVFITAQERSTVSGGLRQAAFWVGLRQEIYVAFVNQRSIIPALEHCNIDRSLEATDDHTWANRIVVHCADVIRYCFGDMDQTHAAYTQLVDYSSDWYNYKPPSFSPIYYRDQEGSSIFPEIWLLGDEVVTALQHWHLARIMLSAHNPKVPRLGPGRARALRAMDEEIKHDVRMLCGMAESNSKSPPNYVTAAMAITMAGDKFTERHEQEALLSVLAKTENDHAWPTGIAQNNMREAWGWNSA